MAEKGIALFDERQYWHAHEALEAAWKEDASKARELYKGILQAGVIYLQIERRNFIGALKMYERCKRWLWPWPDHCRTVDVGRLKADVQAAIDEIVRLGPERLDEFDPALFKTIRRVAAEEAERDLPQRHKEHKGKS